jgi:hypothetical protein
VIKTGLTRYQIRKIMRKCARKGDSMNFVEWSSEFFTVPHVFLPESPGIQVIPGIPGEWNLGRAAC